MLQIYLCDDEPSVLESLAGFIKSIAKKNGLAVSLSCYENAERLIFDLEDNVNGPDIIYMDILMEPCNGISTGKKLRALGCKAQLLYLTASKRYAIASFDTYPLHYILKDEITSARFERIFLEAAKKAQKKAREVFYYEYLHELVCVPVPDIVYAEISGRVATLHAADGREHRFYSSMKGLCERFSPFGFIRAHKSFLINPRYIERLSKSKVVLRGQKEIPVGYKYAKDIKRSLLRYLSHAIGESPLPGSRPTP